MFIHMQNDHLKLYLFFAEISDGFAFSQEEGGTLSQSEVIRCYDTNRPKPEGN